MVSDDEKKYFPLFSETSAKEAACRFFKTEAGPRSIRSPSIVLIHK
jgi:hypothetical protein